MGLWVSYLDISNSTRVLCPRVHFKMLVFDGKEVYVGSANLIGAGIGMKADQKTKL